MRRSLAFDIPVAALLLLIYLPAAHATVVPQPEPLHGLVVAPAGFVATPAPRELSLVQNELSAATLADVSAFRSASGPDWSFWIDRRSGAVALVEGQGIPWASGDTTASALEAKARALISEYPSLFQVPASQLVLDTRATRRFGDRGQFWNVAFHQVIGGVPVEGSFVVFRVSHGNLVQFGVNRAIPISGAAPALTASQAKAKLGQFLGGLLPDDRFLQDGALSWVLRGTADQVGYTGPIGAGWQPSLVYRFLFTRAGSLGTWLALVDARTGEVVRFLDANDYVSVLKASALTEANCTDPANCVPGTAEELPVTLPNAKLEFVGGSCAGAGCYTNPAGAFDWPAGAVSAATTLQGRYFNFVDVCGPIAGTGLAPANPDLGTSDPLANVNTDCFPAHRESAPGSGLLTGGTGDTHSARTMYYHLNLINEKSRYYLPDNDWLKGVDGGDVVPTVATNVPPACNAFWAGGENLFVFMRLTPGLGCNNTGEVPVVGLHEFGHGLDQHDGTGTAPESATGEAMGDTFALLQGQEACFGSGFRLPDPLDPWGNTAGYGDSRSRLCTGVRELDYTRLCSVGAGDDCAAAVDPDAPNGSRSGLNPPAEPADAGTPARWNHMIDTAPAGAADGVSNFYSCGPPEDDGCAGPLNHGCHCESQIASQANWDLAKQLISSEFGGNVYAQPAGPTEVSGWQYMDRLWYLTRDIAVSGYSASGGLPGGGPEGTTSGCTVTDWYSSYRFVDDDNGNLADGTPHADILFSAFDLHGIACGAAADAANQGSGCPAPIAASTVGTCGGIAGNAPVQLTWTPSPGTTQYRVLRNTLGCGFGFTPIGTVGARTYFEDSQVAPDVTYYYSIQPVGQNASCYGQVSNCVTVTPSACGASAVPAPAAVTLSNAGANAIQVAWTAAPGAGSYKILRKAGGCSSTAPEEAVGFVPGTSFVDRDGIVGGQTYSYRVASSAGTCASCAGAASACQSIAATGACDAPPAFAGVKSVTSAIDGQCRLNVAWDAATPGCGGTTVAYDVYRGTDPGFAPSAASRVATGVAATAWSDRNVASGTRYTYVVRAVASNGNTEGNLARRTEAPAGQLTPGTFQDDAGDALPVKLRGWSVRDSGLNDATKQYATSAAGNYASNACLGMESDTIRLGASPALSFRSRYDMETGWDGGYVEVATEDSGFTNWTKLGSMNYPAVMAGPLGDPACGGPGFADGQPAFTGTSLLDQWSSHSGSLAAYAGKAVRIRFLFSSDGSTEQGGWFVDDVKVTDAKLAGPCRSCKELDDSDPAIEYVGFFSDTDPNASNGGYHLRTGGKKNGSPPYARLVFEGSSVTYRYATSKKGGTADVYLDGQLRETLSYEGPTPAIAFGAAKTWSNLGPGSHEIKVVHRTGTVYVDGFDLDCATGQADAAAVDYTTATSSSTADLSLGPIVAKQVQVGANDREVAVLVEGGSQSMTVRLLDPLGLVVATGGSLLDGFTDSGVDASVSKPGTYTVQVLRPLGVTSGKVEISVAKTLQVP